MANVDPSVVTPDFLIRGADYLAAHPDFKMIGRQGDLNDAMDILMKKSAGNNLVLHGPNGVGLSSLVMGLQASKDDPSTPFEIVSKNFFYLDVDALFASADPVKINEGFHLAMQTLEKSSNSVLIIEDTKGFIDGVNNNNCSNLLNILMRANRTSDSFQTMFVSADEDLSGLFKAHADLTKNFSLQDMTEPSKDDLRAILDHATEVMGEKYGVQVTKEAVDSVVELTSKYPGLTLGMAQPKRSISLLEGAMTAYCRTAHARAPELDGLESTLASVTAALAAGRPADGELAGKSPNELETIRLETQTSIDDVTEAWNERQAKIRQLYLDQAGGEQAIQEINNEIAVQRAKDTALKTAREAYKAAPDEAAKQKIKDDYKIAQGEVLTVADEGKGGARVDFGKITGAGFATGEVGKLQDKLAVFEKEVAKNKEKYAALTQDINKNLALTDEHVLGEFSRLSQVPTNKLKQDESEKLLHLEETIEQRVFGQNEPAEALADAVISARAGLKEPNEPIGSFLFLGPSGVGKTEMAKALASALFGDDSALQIYSMSEYSEKHATAVLIGAPPGYEGYDAGGVLTNNMRAKPYCVNLFDEAEKADKGVFDIFLQILDEGTLSDRRGMKASFANSINIMTSNIGSKYFLDESLSFEDAKEKALADLWNPEGDPNDPRGQGGFRPEFLNRFTGIFCFNRLGQPEIIMIAKKNLNGLNVMAAEKGITVTMPDADVEAMCKDQYDPKNGGRGIRNYIKTTIRKDVAKTILTNPDSAGVVEVKYVTDKDKKKSKIASKFLPRAANSNTPAAAPAPVTPKAAPAPGK